MIEITGLKKNYGSFTAVDGVSLKVKPGELYGFLGPNGAGKTTTIKLLVGLLKADEGTILLDGHDIARDTTKAKSIIGYLPQEPYVYEKLSAREFIRFMAEIYRVDSNGLENKIEDLLEAFELTDKADQLIGGFSGGMKQKTLLAGILVHNPKILLLDEPTNGLDPKSARMVKDLLIQAAGRGMTVFLSTHILEIAEKMCTRIGIINQGKLVIEGTVDEIRQTAREGGGSLEDVFLEITGGDEQTDLVRVLGG